MSDSTGQPSTDVRRALAWAAFLGASWTWVIGMFLPVLLIRDFGPAAWFIFAIPNVVGAAAMGWFIRSRQHGETFVKNHRVAARAFSLVTIAFHAYVMLWLVPKLIGPLGASIAFGAALLVLVPVFTTTLRATTLAIATLFASVVIALTLGGMNALALPPRLETPAATLDLVALSIVCTLGFLTCPYLDLTFHRASQASRTPGESRIAFGVGFGVCFCAMIVLTLFYASVFLTGRGGGAALAVVGVHLSVQACFTIAMHASSFRRATLSNAAPALWIAVVAPVIAAFAARYLEAGAAPVGPSQPLIVGEVVYRIFMAFYGLLAPAYVWICVRRADEPPKAGAIRAAAIAALVAMPFYWLAFMQGSMRWALPGVAALFVGWIVVSVARRKADMRERAFKALGGHLQQ